MKEKDYQMEYNTQKNKLTIPEYGRNVQLLIQHAKTLEDNAYRQAFVERIIGLMMQMHPQNRNMDDYKVKMWKHVFRIAEYDIDVTPVDGQKPTPEEARKRPDQVEYPASQAKFRHYGGNVQRLIKKALSMEEGPKRDGFIGVIGAYMKLAYKTWNREHYVSDEIIKGDLATLSGNRLAFKEGVPIDNLATDHSHNNNYNNNYSNNYSNNNYNNYNNNRRRGNYNNNNNNKRNNNNYYGNNNNYRNNKFKKRK